MNTNSVSRKKQKPAPIKDIVEALAKELGDSKQHCERIENLLTHFALEVKRASIEGEW